jgi:hypothetical protein
MMLDVLLRDESLDSMRHLRITTEITVDAAQRDPGTAEV